MLFGILLAARLPVLAVGYVTQAVDIAKMENLYTYTNVAFDIHGTVSAALWSSRLIIADKSGAFCLNAQHARKPVSTRPGDIVHAHGYALAKTKPSDDVWFDNVSVTVLASGEPAAPQSAALNELGRRELVFRTIRTVATAIDVFQDEIDPRWCFLLLKDGDASFVAAAPIGGRLQPPFSEIRDAVVEATGVVMPSFSGYRAFTGSYLELIGDSALKVLHPPSDPFDAPPLESLNHCSPQEIVRMGRRRTSGTVVAVWRGDRFLLAVAPKRFAEVRMAGGLPPPSCNRLIEVSGYPDTDLANLNLTSASFRYLSGTAQNDDVPVNASNREVLQNELNAGGFNSHCRGQLVRLRGTVRSLPPRGLADGKMMLQCGEHLVPVYPGDRTENADAAQVDAVVDVTGVFLIECESWRPGLYFPRVSNCALVMRSPADLTVVKRPPWWTPRRVVAAFALLFAALATILVWNRSLHRLAERRGRELFRSQIDKARSELRTEERTRLAVELHDSISQNLSGVSLQIDTAGRLVAAEPARAKKFLDFASLALDACRKELRDCIWDLRNQALEERDLDDAIRKTVQQALGSAALSVRFNVPRRLLSDNTAHALLRILRELTANAVRHGHARQVRIAGALEGNRLLVSVTDDGCGFDPENRPGIATGHFGLQGVAERVRTFNGSLDIESRHGHGTRIALVLMLPTDGRQPKKGNQ